MDIVQYVRYLYPPEWVLIILQTKIIETQTLYVDVWMFAHLFSGIALGYFIKQWYVVLFALVIFEIVENIFLVPQGLALSESLLQSGFDIVVGMIGFWIGRRLVK